MRVLGLRQLGNDQPGNLTSLANSTTARRLPQHAADDRERRTPAFQERGRGARVVHGLRLVDGAGKFSIRAVHPAIMPLTHGMPLTLINVQVEP